MSRSFGPSPRRRMLRTARLELYPVARGDAAELERMFRDPRVNRYLPRVRRQQSGAIFVRDAARGARDRTAYRFVVRARKDGRFVGAVGLIGLREEERSAELVYAYAREAWGQGYATEVGTCLVRWAFRALRLHRLGAAVSEGNSASAHVLAKLGFRYEGRRREAHRPGRDWADELEFGLLVSEFLADRKPSRRARRPASEG